MGFVGQETSRKLIFFFFESEVKAKICQLSHSGKTLCVFLMVKQFLVFFKCKGFLDKNSKN